MKKPKDDDVIIINLSGNAHNRRKQLRAINRKYPDAIITKRAADEHYTRKTIDDERITVEDANSLQTVVMIRIRRNV